MDKAAQQDVERGFDTIIKKTGELDKAAAQVGKNAAQATENWSKTLEEADRLTKKFGNQFTQAYDKAIQSGKSLAEAVALVRSQLEKSSGESGKNADETKKANEKISHSMRELIKDAQKLGIQYEENLKKFRNLSSGQFVSKRSVEGLVDAARATEELEKRFAQARQEATRLNTIAGNISRNSTTLLAAGAAIVAGAALSAQNYVKFVEQAGIQGDETADRWVAASKRVKNAQLNLGQEAAQALLPVYEQIATLAEKAAGFANAHPELVQAAINTGVVVAAAGAIGLAVSKGIRLIADFKYLAATAEYSLATTRFQQSVREFLAKGLLPSANPGGGAAAGAGGSLIGTLAISAIAIAIGVAIAKAVVDAINQGLAQTDFGKKIDEAQRRAAEGGGGYPGINRYARETEKADQAAEGAAQSTGQLADGLRDFQQEATMAQATTAFIQYRQQEAQAEQQYMEQRAQIVQQGAAQLAQIEANYSQQRAQLTKQYAASSAQALEQFNYQQAQALEQFNYQRAQGLEQFNRSESSAAEEYNNNRREARENYQEEEQRSQEDHRRAMQRLEEDSLDRQSSLVAARDALGLVRERRDLARRQREAEEDFNVESGRRRQEIRQRLQDLEEQFQTERAKRREDFAYQEQQAAEQFTRQQVQAKEQFARQQEQSRQQYEERVRQLDEQHQKELVKARQQTAEKLREIELQYRQERIIRRNAFYDILRDLDANLLGEQKLRQAYYQRMQADLQNLLNSTPRGSNLPGYQSGGYTPEGGIRAHRGEWVANPETTNALERMVGGRLTQEGVRSLTNSSQTINLSFPGGLVTVKQLGSILNKRDGQLLRQLTRELVG